MHKMDKKLDWHEKDYVRSLGQRIRLLREQQGLTQRELGKLANVATDVISRLENGKYLSPGLQTLIKISHALNVDISFLFLERSNPSNHVFEDNNKNRLWNIIHRASTQEVYLLTEIANLLMRYRATKNEPHN